MLEFNLSPLLVSLKTAIASTFLTSIIAIALAWITSRRKTRLKGLLDAILTLPLVLPPTVVGFVLLLIFGKNGPIGKVLNDIGIKVIFSWPATVLAASVIVFPLIYKTACGAFEQIDRNVLNAARTLGASEWRIFWKIAVPLARPGIAAGTVLAFTRALGEFGATLMIAGNIPGKTQTIPIAIYFESQGGDAKQALLWVMIIFIISLSTILLMNRWTKTGRNTFSFGG